MTLTDKDLSNIKDIIEFAVTQSEHSMEAKFDKKLNERLGNLETGILSKMDKEISDIAETNREFLARFDNHESRIETLEYKTGLKTA